MYYGTDRGAGCGLLRHLRKKITLPRSGRDGTPCEGMDPQGAAKKLANALAHCNCSDSESRAHRIFGVAVRLSLVL
jgi:hypothetical protein